MSRTLKRSPQRRSAPTRRRPRTSLLDRFIALLPISEATLGRIATWSIVGATCAAALAVTAWFGVPTMIGVALAEGVGRAGFRVAQIEVTGLKRMDRMSVYAVALDQQSRAMPLVNLEGVRQKLLQYGWIADAHVSRRLPDTLLVHVVERTPVAVWQDRGELSLIAADGVWLEPVKADAMPDLPLVIGARANEQEPAYQQLLDAAPKLRPQVTSATWIGNRRWNLIFATGETLALPEGEAEAKRALAKFAQLDGARPLLGKGWLKFDMRDPDKLVARKPGASSNRAITDPGGDGEIATGAPLHDAQHGGQHDTHSGKQG